MTTITTSTDIYERNDGRKRPVSSVVKPFARSKHASSAVQIENTRPDPRDSSKRLPMLPPDQLHGDRPLSEVNHNRERPRPTQMKSIEIYEEEQKKSTKVHKKAKSTVSITSFAPKAKEKSFEIPTAEPEQVKKPKKSKSSTSLSALLSRPKSSKGFKEDGFRHEREKENRTPPRPADPALPPIWSQFASQPEFDLQQALNGDFEDPWNVRQEMALYTQANHSPSKQRESKQRPKSVCVPAQASTKTFLETISGLRKASKERDQATTSVQLQKTAPMVDREIKVPLSKSPVKDRVSKDSSIPTRETSKSDLTIAKRGSRVMAAVAAWNVKTKEPDIMMEGPLVDPKAIESAFEHLLESRNIPLKMRDKMRSLDTNIKADFVKQDMSDSASSNEGLAAQSSDRDTQKRPLTGQRSKTEDGAAYGCEDGTEADQLTSTKKSRPRSRTFTLHKGSSSPSKKQKSERSSSHGRGKSIELSRPASSKGLASNKALPLGGGAQRAAVPEDFISYLKSVQKPEAVEVGKLHKLRQLLRNETIAWVDLFITKGGMAEVVALLHRTIEVEWREEHEDNLLHESLLCLKALCTTSLALSHLGTIQSTLFPAILGLLFSEDKKGPSEFSTRGVIVSLLFTYLSNSSPAERASRADTLLSYLRDPAPPESEQPPGFITSIYHPRPYRIWSKEMVNVTKEVFWIFLHNLNVLPHPSLRDSSSSEEYTAVHFPGERPPVPAAPYVGGVEWEATNYLATHLDLMNGIIACTPTLEKRNRLRQELKDSGFEKCMGGSLRTCKEKFYGAVHAGLNTWIGAANVDGWDVREIREGPAKQESRYSPRKGGKTEEAPKLQIPKLDLGSGKYDDGGWL